MAITLDTLLKQLQIPEKTSESAYEKPKVHRKYTLPKDNRSIHTIKAKQMRRANAIRIYKLLRGCNSWPAARRKMVAKQIRQQRPSKAEVAAHYKAKGDSKNTIDKLLEGYENLPMVKLDKRDYFVLTDLLNGHGHKHSNYIKRNYR